MTLCENIPIEYLPPVPAPRRRRAGGGARGVQGAYWAAVNAHVDTFRKVDAPELRYAFNGAVMGMRKPAPRTGSWTPGAFSRWLDRFAHHCEHCPGGDRCTALLAAQEMVACQR